MKITPVTVRVEDMCEGYADNGEQGVSAYGGKLEVRPPYQRDFVYGIDKQKSVMSTVVKGYPLSTMYWSVRDDGTYEVLDGQQRTLSLCEYIDGKFSIIIDGAPFYIHNLESTRPDTYRSILDYEITIYICEGSPEKKLEWFETINIAGSPLTDQELRNAAYHGTWLTDAKKRFSRSGCEAHTVSRDYIGFSHERVRRQELLQLALKWVSARDGISVEDYMSLHHRDSNAGDMWRYFSEVVEWAKSNFIGKRKYLKEVAWGDLFLRYGDVNLDPQKTDDEIGMLIGDSNVGRKRGVYEYIFSRDQRCLSLRGFTDNQRHEVYERQGGICAHCGGQFSISEMHADHIIPWSKSGLTVEDNCQMLCADCNWAKSDT